MSHLGEAVAMGAKLVPDANYHQPQVRDRCYDLRGYFAAELIQAIFIRASYQSIRGVGCDGRQAGSRCKLPATPGLLSSN